MQERVLNSSLKQGGPRF